MTFGSENCLFSFETIPDNQLHTKRLTENLIYLIVTGNNYIKIIHLALVILTPHEKRESIMHAKAIVADDHPLFRSAMKQAIQGVLGNNILESASYQQTFDLLKQHQDVELLFLDVNMPGNDGLTGLTMIRSHFPDVLVAIVSGDESPAMVRKAMDFGACGYIPKSTPLPVISDAVQQLLDGEQWLPSELFEQVQKIEDSQEQAFAAKLAQLTPHQLKVLQLMADGLLNKQIAYELGVSESTIKQHVSAVLHKLGFNNRTQAGVLFKQMLQVE